VTQPSAGKADAAGPDQGSSKPRPNAEDPPTDPGVGPKPSASGRSADDARVPVAPEPSDKKAPARRKGADPAADRVAEPVRSTPTNAVGATPTRTSPSIAPTPSTASAATTSAPTNAATMGSMGAATVTPRPAQPMNAPSTPRRARLLVTRLDPWSVMKTSFMLAVSIAIVIVVAVAVLWMVLQVTGVFDSITRTVDDLTGTGTTTVDVGSLISFGRVMGVSLVLAGVEVILVSALATLFAFLYNLSVGITGGLQVTLSEDS